MTSQNTQARPALHNRRNLIILVLLIASLGLINSPQVAPIADWFTQDQIYQQNQQYLAQLKHDAQQDFSRLAALTGLLDVAQSSQIGLSFFAEFNVDVGNALAAFTRLVERGAEIAMASTTAIVLLGLLSDMAEAIAPLALQAALVAAIAWYALRVFHGTEHHQQLARQLTGLTFFIYLLLHMALPYSLHLSAGISQQITAEFRQNNSHSLQQIHLHIMGDNNKQDLKEKAEKSVDKLKKMSSVHINQKVEALSSYVIKNLALTLFDLLLMPALLLLLLFRAGMLITNHMVEIAHQAGLQENRK